MAVTFTNNYKNILDSLESILKSEFKGALPVYKGTLVPKGVNQALQLVPVGSTLVEYNSTGQLREFTVQILFIFNEANIKERALDYVMRYVARIHKLIENNMSMTLSDNSSAFKCRLESDAFNADDDSGLYVVDFEYKCMHLEI